MLAEMLGDDPAAADDFIIGMGSEHEQPLAAEQRRLVRNRLRLGQHAG
jgi:hypothetical protein